MRRSRTLPWGDGCNIISFCFRTTELYERGVEYEWERAAAAEEGEEFGPPEGVEWEAFELDNAMYRVVESKLGVHHHTWTSLEYFDEHPEAMPVSPTSLGAELLL